MKHNDILFISKGISIPTPFFSLKQSESEYGVRNVPTQLHISLHNEIYFINGVIYFLFVHHSIMELEMEQGWSNFTPFSLLLYFRGKNGVLHWRCSNDHNDTMLHFICWHKFTIRFHDQSYIIFFPNNFEKLEVLKRNVFLFKKNIFSKISEKQKQKNKRDSFYNCQNDQERLNDIISVRFHDQSYINFFS